MQLFRNWRRPGPMPPGGVAVEEGETLNYICGHYRIFQYAKGHRFSTDDVLTAWYATQCAPRVARAADLGSGIGSVALIVAWRLPGATLTTIEAQAMSVRLARKSVRYNGLESRFTIAEGDLREFATDEPFDLVTGSPPYFPSGSVTEASHPQAIPARVEKRGTIDDYARTAMRILAPGGVFVFVFPFGRSIPSLRLIRRRDVIFKEGEAPSLSLYAAGRVDDFPPDRPPFVEPPLTIRRGDGSFTDEYSALRLSFGFPPWE